MTIDRDVFPWPEANARPGDDVWFRPDAVTEWQTDWTVAAVSKQDKQGHHFYILIKRGHEELIVSPQPPEKIVPYEGWLPDGGVVQVLVVPKEPPTIVCNLLARYPRLLAVRDGANCDGCRIRLICIRCWTWLAVSRVTTITSTAGLMLHGYADKDAGAYFAEGKPVDAAASTVEAIRCDCKDTTYDVTFDTYYEENDEQEGEDD